MTNSGGKPRHNDCMIGMFTWSPLWLCFSDRVSRRRRPAAHARISAAWRRSTAWRTSCRR